jgi:hypothetical protein
MSKFNIRSIWGMRKELHKVGWFVSDWWNASLELEETNCVQERDGVTIRVGTKDGKDRILAEDSIA